MYDIFDSVQTKFEAGAPPFAMDAIWVHCALVRITTTSRTIMEIDWYVPMHCRSVRRGKIAPLCTGLTFTVTSLRVFLQFTHVQPFKWQTPMSATIDMMAPFLFVEKQPRPFANMAHFISLSHCSASRVPRCGVALP